VIPEGWRESTLADSADIVCGFPFKSSDFRDSGSHRLLRGDNVGQGVAKWDGVKWMDPSTREAMYSLRPHDVVLAMDRPWVGAGLKCAVVQESDTPSLLVQRVARLRAKGEVDQRFLGYAVNNATFAEYVVSVQTGTSIPHISSRQIGEHRLLMPPLDRQRAVAAVLGALDDKIAANTKLASTAEDLARTLASAVPVTVPLGEIVEHIKTTVNPDGLADDRVAHFSLPAFDAGIEPEVVGPQEIKSNKFLVGEPSVLVSKLNPRFPRVWNIPTISPLTSLASTEFVTLRPRFSSTTLLWALTSQPAFGSALEAMVAGTSGSHQRVKPAEMLSTLVPDPRVMSDVLVGQIDALGLRAISSRDESRTLAATRDALLPQLMSGKLRVKDAERAVSEVA